MIYRRCNRCNKRIESGTKCSCYKQAHKEYKQYRRDKKEQKFYSSNDYIEKRNKIRDRCLHLDVLSFYLYNKEIEGSTVHHIVPVKEDWSKRLDEDNMIYVSESTHQMIHKEYDKNEDCKEKMQDKLRKAKKYFEEKFLDEGGI